MKQTVTLTFLLSLAVGSAAIPLAAQAEQFFPKAYLGLALGLSTLAPEANIALAEDEDAGFKLLFGYDLSERSSVEFHAADLGEATFATDATLGYQTYGAEMLYHLFASEGLDGLEYRRGLLAYVKAGVGFLRNSNQGINYEREHDWHISLGAGASLGLTEKTRLRLEFNAYDTDAHLLSLGLVRRFSAVPAWPFRNQAPAPILQPVVAVAPPPPKPEPEPQPLPPSDVDNDGVDDSRDLCPATPINRRVDESGCVFGGVLEGVQFELNSARLTLPATARLDAVIQDMQRYPKLRIQITAHTDNQGSATYNLELSIKRARSVAEYLIEHGISPDRLRAVGAGESQPIYRNDTPTGRQGNRRVVFKVLNY
ncbi:MAG: OmpA family protein [Granulosicoccaceae bacterium]